MSALTDVTKQAMEYFCDRGSVDTYSEEWGFYLALRDALAQEPNPEMHEKSLGAGNSASTPGLRDAALVAAAEREACARECEQYNDDGGTGETWGLRFAALIRARGTS